MTLDYARALALKEMTTHGLIAAGWSFNFDPASKRFGVCRYGKKRITLSRPLTILNDLDEVHDTILHEIAHALTPGHKDHDAVWQAKAIELGAKPRKTFSFKKVTGLVGWVMVCPRCNRQWKRHRKMDKYQRSCPHCTKLHTGKSGFNENYLIEWVKGEHNDLVQERVIKRPLSGKTLQVWETCDRLFNVFGGMPPRKVAIYTCVNEGIARGTAVTQYNNWYRYMKEKISASSKSV